MAKASKRQSKSSKLEEVHFLHLTVFVPEHDRPKTVYVDCPKGSFTNQEYLRFAKGEKVVNTSMGKYDRIGTHTSDRSYHSISDPRINPVEKVAMRQFSYRKRVDLSKL